jgi:very-short-patch-repair endonuclease
MAAVLVSGPGAALSHRSAAALWAIRDASSRTVEVTSPAKSRSSRTVEHHFSRLPVDETTEEDGIPVTTVPRTIFDLAAVVRVNAVEQALRQSERLRLYDALSLEDLLRRYPRRQGTRTIRECLRRRRELPSGVTREELEARFLVFLERAGIPRPRFNAWLTVGGRRCQVDCLWTGQKVIVELDGYASHGTRAAFEDDRDRDRRLAVAGFRWVRVTWRQLHEIPAEVAADLAALLRG